jgi:hypothetical protein
MQESGVGESEVAEPVARPRQPTRARFELSNAICGRPVGDSPARLA